MALAGGAGWHGDTAQRAPRALRPAKSQRRGALFSKNTQPNCTLGDSWPMEASERVWDGATASVQRLVPRLVPHLLLGAVVAGSYRLTNVLGQGGMGVVYLGQHVSLPGKRVAIKVLAAELDANAAAAVVQWVRGELVGGAAGRRAWQSQHGLRHAREVQVADVPSLALPVGCVGHARRAAAPAAAQTLVGSPGAGTPTLDLCIEWAKLAEGDADDVRARMRGEPEGDASTNVAIREGAVLCGEARSGAPVARTQLGVAPLRVNAAIASKGDSVPSAGDADAICAAGIGGALGAASPTRARKFGHQVVTTMAPYLGAQPAVMHTPAGITRAVPPHEQASHAAPDPASSRAACVSSPSTGTFDEARDDGLWRFFDEALLLAQLPGESIVEVYDIGALADGRPYIVMEYFAGGSLADVVARHGLPPLSVAVDIISQIAVALDAAHLNRPAIVHRDVKLENILVAAPLTHEWKVVCDASPHHVEARLRVALTDFGVAKHRNATQGLTAASQLLGSPGYMAPEVLTPGGAAAVDGRADVYSLASLFYQLVTGRLPYDGPSSFAMMARLLEGGPIAPLRTLRPEAPSEWDAVVARALAREPENRTKRAGDFACALASTLRASVTEADARPWGLTMAARVAGADHAQDDDSAATRKMRRATIAKWRQRLGTRRRDGIRVRLAPAVLGRLVGAFVLVAALAAAVFATLAWLVR